MNKVESALQRTTDTKALVIGVGTLPQTAEMFNEVCFGCRAVVVADTKPWRVAGGECTHLADAGIGQDEPHVFADPKLYAEWSFVEELDGVLAATDAVPVAVGSGVINDLTKLCSTTTAAVTWWSARRLRWMVIGLRASITKGRQQADLRLSGAAGHGARPRFSAAAPASMSASGYADLIAKDPGRGRLDAFRRRGVGADGRFRFFGLVQDGLKEALRSRRRACGQCREGRTAGRRVAAERFRHAGHAVEPPALRAPNTSSATCGTWNTSNTTGLRCRTASKVGIGTLASTAFLEMLLDAPREQLDIEKRCVAAWKSWDETERDIAAIFNDDPEFVARGLKETRDKYVDREGLRDQLTRLKRRGPN